MIIGNTLKGKAWGFNITIRVVELSTGNNDYTLSKLFRILYFTQFEGFEEDELDKKCISRKSWKNKNKLKYKC